MCPARSYSLVARAGLPALVLVVAFALRVPLLGGGQIDYDEGVYWESLRLLAAGHPLFASVYSSQPPAFLLLLLPAHTALGGTIFVERLTVLAIALAGIAAAGWTAAVLAGRGAGLLAAALLAADPIYFRESVTLQADGPAVAMALVGLAAAAEATRRRGRAGIALAGAAGAVLAVALLTKLLAAAALPALLVLLALPAPGARPLTRLAAMGGGAVLAAGALLLPFAAVWPEAWRQVVGLHLAARALPLGGLGEQTVLRELPVAALGAAGCLVAARRARRLAAAGAAWVAAAGLLLVAQHPLWPHHAVVLVCPLALLGGGLARLFRFRTVALGSLLALAASAASALLLRGQQLPPSVDAPSVAALRAATAPGDLVVSDDQFAVALAGRDVPPQLVDTSLVRIETGDLTAASVEAIVERAGVRAVLFGTGRLALDPGLRGWVASRFPVAVDLGGGRTLYLRPANG